MTLDTVKLHLKDYSITGESTLTVQPATYIAGTGEVVSEFPLFQDTAGKKFKGSKAYLNTDRLNLTIQPFTRSEAGTSCFVSFSVPKIHYGNNFYSVGEEGAQAVFNLVEKELWQAGIHTDIQEAGLSRVDTFKNIQTEEPFSSYYTLFPLLKARRAIQRGYGTTFLVHNTQQEFCVYDKLAEMKNREIDTTPFPAQTMRFEHRLLNKQKIEKVYGFSSVSALFSGGYSELKTRQREEWRKSLFSHSVEEVVMLGSRQLEQEMRFFKQRFERNWFEWFLKSYGAYHLAQVAGVEVVRIALQNVEAERTKVWRAEKMLLDTKREIEMLKQEEGSNKTLGVLYQELKEKVCLN